MRFSTILGAFALFSFSSIVAASPVIPGAGVQLERRDTASVYAKLQDLKTANEEPLSQISALVSSGSVTYDAVKTPIDTIITNINTAKGEVAALRRRGLVERQSGDELADLVAEIVEAVVDVLETLVGDLATIPLLATLLTGVDAALANLLSELELLVAGLLELVAQLLTNLSTILTDLAFDLTLAALGL
ncbi:hypothetical protein DL93DRAFT_2165141 [Clavulina sp. PMI_390]|nr:hypothetical protein DL93DRAFT_2165141 [Clavulina sp. PMI_390]